MQELCFGTKVMRAADLGEECCVPDLLGEHILQNQLKFYLDEEDEIYEGYGRRKNAYPYRQYNLYTRKLEEREIRTAILENDHLKAVFLPEYGGRLWELWDKNTGKNLLYTNDVLRFSNLAIRNAWFSGGVEWNIGLIGHTPFTVESLYTAVTKTESGAPVLRFYEYERIRKVTYQVDFWLEEENHFLNCRMRVVNESDQVVPMYWWSNIAVPEYEGGHIIVPARKAFTNSEGGVYKVDIPMVEGVDITDYKKIPRSVDYFFDLDEEKPKYIANIDKDGYGLLHMSTKRLQSRKLFSWGNSQASDRWQEFLTDQAGRYLEIQAGLGKTQYGCIPMAPHTAWEWMEKYGAVQIPESNAPHREREAYLTEMLKKAGCVEQMEQELKETASMAKSGAELMTAGSGYGAMVKHGPWTEHLEFIAEKDSLKQWKRFFETGILQEPPVNQPPDEFLIDKSNLSFLVDTLQTVNKDNWYAYYQAGIGCFEEEYYQHGEKFLLESWKLKENPWACHGLACTYFMTDQKKKAAEWMKRGLSMAESRISYLKEGLKILSLCEAYQEVTEIYENQEREIQEVGKLKYYYIHALHMLGEDKKAYELLEEKGGLVIDDIREGEDSVAQLWSESYESQYGEKGTIPYRYDFKA